MISPLQVIGVYMKEKEGAQYWTSKSIPNDHLLVNYCSTKLTKSQQKMVDFYVLVKFETCLFRYVYDFPLIALEGRFGMLYLYSDVQDFVSSNTFFNDLTLNSLRVSFRVLLITELLAFLLFLGRRLFHRPRRPNRPVRVNYDDKFDRVSYQSYQSYQSSYARYERAKYLSALNTDKQAKLRFNYEHNLRRYVGRSDMIR